MSDSLKERLEDRMSWWSKNKNTVYMIVTFVVGLLGGNVDRVDEFWPSFPADDIEVRLTDVDSKIHELSSRVDQVQSDLDQLKVWLAPGDESQPSKLYLK